MSSERQRALQLGRSDPVMHSKTAVDDAYDAAVELCLGHIAASTPKELAKQVSFAPVLMLATHNKQSIANALDGLHKLGISNNSPNVHCAQILGMCDHITVLLGYHGYNASQLICFGDFEQIMPWLLRRFQENQVK